MFTTPEETLRLLIPRVDGDHIHNEWHVWRLLPYLMSSSADHTGAWDSHVQSVTLYARYWLVELNQWDQKQVQRFVRRRLVSPYGGQQLGRFILSSLFRPYLFKSARVELGKSEL